MPNVKPLYKGDVFSLNQGSAAFRIEEGAVEVFARLKSHTHSLQFLGSFEHGVLFSFAEESPYEFFAKCITATKLVEVSSDEKELAAWQAALSTHISGPPPTERATWERAFAKALTEFVQTHDQLEKAVISSRSEEEQVNFAFAIEQMEHVLAPESEAIIKPSQDPLIQACQLLAHHLHVSLRLPQESGGSVRERLTRLCEASGLQLRKVRLRETWWKIDHGPLLGFFGDDEKPIALLPAVGTIYQMNGRIRVDRAIGEQCSLDAYMLYRPFDEEIRTGKQVLAYVLKPYVRRLIGLLGFGLIGGVIGLFPAIATKLLFAYAIVQSNPTLVGYLTAGLVFSALGLAYFYCVREFLFLKISVFSAHLANTSLWQRLLALSPQMFRKFNAGNLFLRTFATHEIQVLVSQYASNLSLNLFASLLYLLVMLAYAPKLAVLVALIGATAVVITMLIARRTVKLWRQILELQGNLRGVTIQMIEGVGKVRIAGAERSAFAYWASFFSQSKRLQLRLNSLQNSVNTWMAFLPILGFVLIYTAMLVQDTREPLSLSNFLAFNLALGSFAMAFYPLPMSFLQLIKVIPLWERTKPIFEERPEERAQKLDPGQLQGHIQMDSLIFGYNPFVAPILREVSIEVRPKEFVAIVGKSGCGKSTLIRLLLGFETPSAGAVYFDRKDLASLDPHKVRKQIGVVMQGEGVLAGNLYENLVGGGACTQEELDEALRLSGFDQDLAEFPMGLHTVIPMNGTTLSGGQKQRLLLARALIRKPEILVLDEATSGLDSHTQDTVCRNIEKLDITRLVVAQRLSTIKKADRIYVLDKGQIVQTGTFAELSATPGLFSEMLMRQQL